MAEVVTGGPEVVTKTAEVVTKQPGSGDQNSRSGDQHSGKDRKHSVASPLPRGFRKKSKPVSSSAYEMTTGNRFRGRRKSSRGRRNYV